MTSITPNLKINDIGKSLEFYEKILGFEIIMKVPDVNPVWIMLKNGNAEIMLQQKESIEEEYPSLKEKESGALTFYTIVEDSEVLYGKIKNNVNIIHHIHITPYGRKEFSVTDPDGFIFTFAS
ncbi:MAG TPA: VOC family protein [Spirochaetota bacterium]|nr:VOC family protein [Spirochaetota bacterium]HQE59059.1 VOC family protein [Spirochaetota bacterium]